MKHAIAFTLFASAAVGFAQQNKDPVSSVVKEILPPEFVFLFWLSRTAAVIAASSHACDGRCCGTPAILPRFVH